MESLVGSDNHECAGGTPPILVSTAYEVGRIDRPSSKKVIKLQD